MIVYTDYQRHSNAISKHRFVQICRHNKDTMISMKFTTGSFEYARSANQPSPKSQD